MKKLKILAAVAIMVLSAAPVSAKVGSWGLSFGKPGTVPRGEETAEYLKKYDGYYVLPGSGKPAEDGKKTIYLTFDAGYENGYTEKILDVLKENDVKATFFLVGTYIKNNPELSRRILDEGHVIGNHTTKHPNMTKLSDAAFGAELASMEKTYKEVLGTDVPKIYRPPSGNYSEENLKSAHALGYKTFFWSVAYGDYDDKNQPSHKEAFAKLLPRVHDGAIILLHSTSRTNMEILDELIKKYKDMGYEVAPLMDAFE